MRVHEPQKNMAVILSDCRHHNKPNNYVRTHCPLSDSAASTAARISSYSQDSKSS